MARVTGVAGPYTPFAFAAMLYVYVPPLNGPVPNVYATLSVRVTSKKLLDFGDRGFVYKFEFVLYGVTDVIGNEYVIPDCWNTRVKRLLWYCVPRL